MKRIIYTSVSLAAEIGVAPETVWRVRPSPSHLAQYSAEAEALAALLPTLPTDAQNVRIVDQTEYPSMTPGDVGQRFRNCWRVGVTGLPVINMPLARIQRMNEVRAERAPKLTKSDVDLLRAQEAGTPTLVAAIKTFRQALRDLPATEQPRLDAMTTPDALAAWQPTWPVDPAS